MNESDKTDIIKAAAFRTIKRLMLKSSDESVKFIDRPSTLYLHVSGNVEWTILSGHAWGRVSVSTDAGGADLYPVASLKLQIVMDTPEQQNRTIEANNATSVDNDVKYGSTFNPIFSGPHSLFVATASDPSYGTWSASTTVY